ncbi:hypothetical protein pb186bvf_003256 [Paramecium bursaria]
MCLKQDQAFQNNNDTEACDTFSIELENLNKLKNGESAKQEQDELLREKINNQQVKLNNQNLKLSLLSQTYQELQQYLELDEELEPIIQDERIYSRI